MPENVWKAAKIVEMIVFFEFLFLETNILCSFGVVRGSYAGIYFNKTKLVKTIINN